MISINQGNIPPVPEQGESEKEVELIFLAFWAILQGTKLSYKDLNAKTIVDLFNTEFPGNDLFKTYSNYNNNSMSGFIKYIDRKTGLNFSKLFNIGNNRINKYLTKDIDRLKSLMSDSLKKLLGENLKKLKLESLKESTIVDLIKNQITLNKSQAKTVYNKYMNYIQSGMSESRALKKINKIVKQLQKERAKFIAKNELRNIRSESEIESLIQARDSKLINQVYKLWIRNFYTDNHQNSIDNDGRAVLIDEVWPDLSPYPNKPNERCTMEYVFNVNPGGE